VSLSLEKDTACAFSSQDKGDSGVLVVDKPADISSAGVVRILKRMFNAKKVGHAGTLDPFATGVLVCCINKATRLADFFLKSGKTYQAEMVLGEATDTQDATGRVISRCDNISASKGDIHRVFNRFKGDILQQPPVYSALKHNGVPLYKLARKGKPVQKPPRTVNIQRLAIMDVNLPEVRFEVSCSAGTYIRTLCADVGAMLGCGGHLKTLRRIKSGGFTVDEAVSLSGLKALAQKGGLRERLISMADALQEMPGMAADDVLKEKIINGKSLHEVDLASGSQEMPDGYFKVVDQHHRLVAVLNRKKGLGTYEYRCVFPE